MAVSSIAQLDSTRKKIIVLLLSFAGLDAIVSLFGYANSESGFAARTEVTDLEAMISAGIAAGLSAIVVTRQGVGGLHGKTYAALAVGIVLWFSGEIVWVYYEVGLKIELPEYSIADAFWLIGYPFFGYHLFRTYKYFARAISKPGIIAVGIPVGLAIVYLIYQMFIVADLATAEGVTTFLFRTSYPVGDFFLIFPSILLLVTLRKAKLHYSPWLFVSLSLLITGFADSLFSYLSLTGQVDVEWIANLLYDSAYLCMAGGLYWYNRFVIFDENRASRSVKDIIK